MTASKDLEDLAYRVAELEEELSASEACAYTDLHADLLNAVLTFHEVLHAGPLRTCQENPCYQIPEGNRVSGPAPWRFV